MTSIYTLENQLSEQIKKMKEIATEEFNQCNKFHSEKECFNIISDKLVVLNLTNGYKAGNSEIQALLLIDNFYNKIDFYNKSSMETENILLSLIDLVSHHVTLFDEDAWTEECIDYFNEKHGFSEYYKISSTDFKMLYSFYYFLYMIAEADEFY